ncbi:GMP/IMP nucleotidase [Microbulbifer sp. ALW1]|uniref:GMP/IMP nucleotidase n=1 Tax=Microbulbifer sp. (strain ALW1) TaxID=1516059 RepID=UPI00135C0C8B|nr:GMP/IMP nucleotidase [Microbulbifer sp. ALW1]
MLDWSRIDTVLLDMDGTLLDLHYDNHFWMEHLPLRYAEANGISVPEAQALVIRMTDELRGTLDWYCLHYWSDALKLDVPAIYREIEDRIALRPHTDNFLRSLRTMQKRALLVTNAHPDGLNHKLEITGIDQWLDEIVSSHDLGHAKESSLFWHSLQERQPFDPERTLFVDDNLHVLGAARDYGIANLLCIRQPDSKNPAREITEFPAIHDFDEILWSP